MAAGEVVTLSDGRSIKVRPMTTGRFFEYCQLENTDVQTVWMFFVRLTGMTDEEIHALPWLDTRALAEASLRVNAMTTDEADTLGKD